ncbi:MAG TPA: glycosyltransferase family 4 protein [Ktedonobacterales bacterium]|nr:glycosyltransferase family 4 protein [Ktedonobacterales bacterium]
MKIVVCNKYYFVTGGPERYMFGLSDVLQGMGHEVIPFSVSSVKNEPTPYEPYFVSPPVSGELYGGKLTQKKLSLGTKVRMVQRAIYSREARQKLRALIHDTQADVVYVLNFTSYLSPSIIDAARDEHVPVVVRLSSFDLICANHMFLRDGKICTECMHGKYHSVLHRCVGGSFSASLAKSVAMYYHDLSGIYKRIDAFVAPARFMEKTLITAGYPPERIHHIPTFVDSGRFQPRLPDTPIENYILYFGRIAPDKGLGTLIDAYALLGPHAPPLLLMGWSEPAEEQRLRARCAELGLTNVHFIGAIQGEKMVSMVQQARFVIVSSVWFENTPNAVYEAFACGRPVIATNIGSLPEQVVPEYNGLLFELNNPGDLARQMRRLLDDPHFADRLGANGLEAIHHEYSAQTHADRLLALFRSLARGGAQPARSVGILTPARRPTIP